MIPSYKNTNLLLSENNAMQQIRDFTKKQRRAKGFYCLSSANGVMTNLVLSGDAKIFLGLSLFINSKSQTSAFYNTTIDFSINNEKIIDRVNSLNFICMQKEEDFVEIIRPLNSTDVININIIDAGTNDYFVTLWYI